MCKEICLYLYNYKSVVFRRLTEYIEVIWRKVDVMGYHLFMLVFWFLLPLQIHWVEIRIWYGTPTSEKTQGEALYWFFMLGGKQLVNRNVDATHWAVCCTCRGDYWNNTCYRSIKGIAQLFLNQHLFFCVGYISSRLLHYNEQPAGRSHVHSFRISASSTWSTNSILICTIIKKM
jgi:hypothetical protein